MHRAATAALSCGLALAATASGDELLRVELSAAPSPGRQPTWVESLSVVSLERETSGVPLSVLATSGTEIVALEASLDGVPVPVTLDRSDHPQLRGVVSIPAGARAHGDVNANGAPASILVRYRVLGAVTEEGDRLSIAIPVVIVGSKPTEARPDGFTAFLELPAALHVRESFPTGIARAGNDGFYRIELPIVPAFVALEASESRALLTFPRLVDLGSLLLLAALGALVLREVRGRAHAP